MKNTNMKKIVPLVFLLNLVAFSSLAESINKTECINKVTSFFDVVGDYTSRMYSEKKKCDFEINFSKHNELSLFHIFKQDLFFASWSLWEGVKGEILECSIKNNKLTLSIKRNLVKPNITEITDIVAQKKANKTLLLNSTVVEYGFLSSSTEKSSCVGVLKSDANIPCTPPNLWKYLDERNHKQVEVFIKQCKGFDINREGASVDSYDDRTPLHSVVHFATPEHTKQDLKMIQILVKAGADIDKQAPLAKACTNNNYEIFKYLIKKGADVNGLYRKKDGETILMECVRRGVDINLPAFISDLFKAGADVNAVDIGGDTALIELITTGNGGIRAVKALLKHPLIKVNLRNNRGRTALDYAIDWKRDPKIIEALKKAGAVR